MVDTLKSLRPGDVITTAQATVKVYKVDTKAEAHEYLMCKSRHKGDGDEHGRDFVPEALHTDEWYGRPLARFWTELAHVKAVAPDFVGHAKSDQTQSRRLGVYLSGDKKAYKAFVRANKAYASESVTYGHDMIDATDGTITPNPNPLTALVDTKRFKKMDLICAVIAVHGPSFKDDVLRRVAALEGKAWVIGSNTDYFTINMQGAIEVCGKGARGKHLYHNTVEGWRRGSQVLGEIDAKVIEALK